MYNNDRIIITMTSYRKRIHHVYDIIITILNNSIVPYKIICNLSTEEFPQKEKELPEKLVNLQKNGVFEIYWVKENVRQFKKLIPTLERFPNDIIISIDDDYLYGKDFIKTLFDEYLKHERQCPITTGSYIWENNVNSHCGGGTLVTSSMFGDYLNDLYYNFALNHILENKIKVYDDPLYTYAMLLNGKRYKYVKVENKIIPNLETITYPGNSVYRKHIFHWHDMIKGYIKEKFNKTYDELFFAPINVNFTTWKKREKAVPIMLETIKKQTLKPDRIIVFLSETEYENVVPDIIKKMLDNGYITDIEWVKGNIYSHKRWEAIKKYNNCYNIFVDDDIYYTNTYVQDLYNKAIKNQGCEIVWTTQIEEINGVRRTHPIEAKGDKSKKFQTLSGLSCFPPYTYPLESFKHSEERDKYCTKCDDSWNRAWLIKNGIDIVRVNNRHKVGFKGIPNTDKDGIWGENKQYTNGIENIMHNFANALICANAVNEAKKIYPNFDIYRCCTFIKDSYNKSQTQNVIISLTTWKKRIGNIPTVLGTILKQTMSPYKIVINLSSEEFSNKEKDIPEDVLKFIENNKTIEINWVEGANTRQWKKFVPTMLKYPNDWVICIDDDKLYWPDFVKSLWEKHLKYPNNAITINKTYKVKGYLQHCGCGTLECAAFYNHFKDVNYDEFRTITESSDTVYNYLLNRYGHGAIPYDSSKIPVDFNSVEPLSRKYLTCNSSTHNQAWEWLEKKYGKIGKIEEKYPSVKLNVSNVPSNVKITSENIMDMYQKGVVVLKEVKKTPNEKKIVEVPPKLKNRKWVGGRTLATFLS